MKYEYSIHRIGGYIFGLADKPDLDTSNGVRYRVEKIFAHGAMEHFKEGQWAYVNPKSERETLVALFELYKIGGIK